MEAVHHAARKCDVLRGVLLSGISVTLEPAGLSREKASEEGGWAGGRLCACVHARVCVGVCECAHAWVRVRVSGKGGGKGGGGGVLLQ
jgi:hypothetical protein